MLMWHVDSTPGECGTGADILLSLRTRRDQLVMMETVKRCKEHNIKVGAHPGLPDLQGFGGREIKLSPEELEANTRYHAGALKGFLDHEGVPLHHVKPQGILYGMMCRDYEVAKAVMLGIPKGVPVFGLAGTNTGKSGKRLGHSALGRDVRRCQVQRRCYDREKRVWDLEIVRNHVTQQLETQSVVATDGSTVQLPVNDYPIFVCCHLDSPMCWNHQNDERSSG